MFNFVKEHAEGIILFILGGGISFVIWFFSYYKKQIIKEVNQEFEKKYNDIEKTLTNVENRITLLEQKQDFVLTDVKQDFTEIKQDFTEIKQDVTNLSNDLNDLKQIKEGLKNAHDLMLFQYDSLHTAFREIKDFLQEKFDKPI